MVSEVRVASTRRENTSRPSWSVPNRNNASVRLAVADAEQMDVGREQAEQTVRIAVREQRQVARFAGVRRVAQLEGPQVALALQRVDMRVETAVGVEPVDRLRRDVAARRLGVERRRE